MALAIMGCKPQGGANDQYGTERGSGVNNGPSATPSTNDVPSSSQPSTNATPPASAPTP